MERRTPRFGVGYPTAHGRLQQRNGHLFDGGPERTRFSDPDASWGHRLHEKVVRLCGREEVVRRYAEVLQDVIRERSAPISLPPAG